MDRFVQDLRRPMTPAERDAFLRARAGLDVPEGNPLGLRPLSAALPGTATKPCDAPVPTNYLARLRRAIANTGDVPRLLGVRCHGRARPAAACKSCYHAGLHRCSARRRARTASGPRCRARPRCSRRGAGRAASQLASLGTSRRRRRSGSTRKAASCPPCGSCSRMARSSAGQRSEESSCCARAARPRLTAARTPRRDPFRCLTCESLRGPTCNHFAETWWCRRYRGWPMHRVGQRFAILTWQAKLACLLICSIRCIHLDLTVFAPTTRPVFLVTRPVSSSPVNVLGYMVGSTRAPKTRLPARCSRHTGSNVAATRRRPP